MITIEELLNLYAFLKKDKSGDLLSQEINENPTYYNCYLTFKDRKLSLIVDKSTMDIAGEQETMFKIKSMHLIATGKPQEAFQYMRESPRIYFKNFENVMVRCSVRTYTDIEGKVVRIDYVNAVDHDEIIRSLNDEQ